jgi:hypothetical protein
MVAHTWIVVHVSHPEVVIIAVIIIGENAVGRCSNEVMLQLHRGGVTVVRAMGPLAHQLLPGGVGLVHRLI